MKTKPKIFSWLLIVHLLSIAGCLQNESYRVSGTFAAGQANYERYSDLQNDLSSIQLANLWVYNGTHGWGFQITFRDLDDCKEGRSILMNITYVDLLSSCTRHSGDPAA